MVSFSFVLTAVRNVTRQAHRSRAALVAVICGVMAMTLAAGFIDWNLRFGRDNTIQSQLGHIQIMKPGFLDNGRADPYGYLLPLMQTAERDTLNRLPGFQVAAPRLLISGLASSGETTLSFIGEGIDPLAEQTLSSSLRFPKGHNLVVDQPKSAIVGRGLAQNLGLEVGAPLILIANTERGGVNAVETEVVGIFESISQAYDDVSLRIPIALARDLMRIDGEHLRLVLLERTDDTTRALEQLRESLPADRYQVVPWHDLADFYNKTAALFAKQVAVIYLIISVIIVLAISNTMTMAVMERLSEIGTLMALGTQRWQILTMFVLEGCILGVLGALIGAALGVLAGVAITAVGIPMPPGPGMSWGYEAGILLSGSNLLEATGLAWLAAAGASIYPAWKASRLEIVDALRARQ